MVPLLVAIQVRQAVSPTAQVQAILDDPTHASAVRLTVSPLPGACRAIESAAHQRPTLIQRSSK
jgi:hypothetical protein